MSLRADIAAGDVPRFRAERQTDIQGDYWIVVDRLKAEQEGTTGRVAGPYMGKGAARREAALREYMTRFGGDW